MPIEKVEGACKLQVASSNHSCDSKGCGVGVGGVACSQLESESGVGVVFFKLLESESESGFQKCWSRCRFFKTAGVGVGSRSRFFKTAGVGVGILKNLPTPQPWLYHQQTTYNRFVSLSPPRSPFLAPFHSQTNSLASTSIQHSSPPYPPRPSPPMPASSPLGGRC